MSIRAILLDMDGTLLGKSQVAVSVRNMEAVQRVLQKGIEVIPCTGRVFDMMPPQILTQEGLRYYITCHGAAVYDRREKKNIYEDTIPAEESARLLEILEGKNYYNEIAAQNTIFFEKAIVDSLSAQPVPEHHIWYMRDCCYTAVGHPSEYFLKQNVRVEKMNLYGIPEDEQQTLYEQLTALGFIRHTRPGAGPNLEFSHVTLDKLKAVDAVLKRLNIDYSETMAFGDSSSDAGILRACALGIAMGNAPDEIKTIANDMTAANTADGVALALEKYIL